MERMSVMAAAAALFAWAIFTSPALAEANGASEAQIRKLIEVTDAQAQVRKMIPAISRQIWSQILRRVPNVSEKLREEITAKMAEAMAKLSPVFVELTVPIYQRHLTSEEADAAIAFYSTPVGKSFARKVGKISIEAFRAGAQLGQTMAKRAAEIALKRLREKGYQL